ncbi:MAG: ribosome silencing factor [Succinivibrionaceae bacterium]|nr:ribosome silencing factor [Succinivibrionaceae bacterium]
MDTNTIVKNILNAIDDIKGRDAVTINVQGKSTVTDAYVICTATSTRHSNAIANKVDEALSKLGVKSIGIEGENPGDWVLVDFGNVVLHVLIAEARDAYQLEQLYRS